MDKRFKINYNYKIRLFEKKQEEGMREGIARAKAEGKYKVGGMAAALSDVYLIKSTRI